VRKACPRIGPGIARHVAGLAVALAITPAMAQPLDKVSFGTNWVAEAEHG